VPEFIQTWAQAIAQFEGFNTAGTVAARNNNPGNLKFAGQAGATGQDSSGFAIFPSTAAGWQALYNQLSAYVSEFPGFSLLQIMAHYLGQPTPTTNSQGNAFTYASFVASALGVDPSTTLAALAGLVATVDSQAPPPADSTGADGSGDTGTVPVSAVDGSGPSTAEILGIAAAAALTLYTIFDLI